MKMTTEQQPFNGSEIWHFLSQLTLQMLCSYELRRDALREQLQRDVFDKIPTEHWQHFRDHFIAKINPKETPSDVQFEIALDKELDNTLLLAKSLLCSTANNHSIRLNDTNVVKYRKQNPVDSVHQLIQDTSLQILLGIPSSVEIRQRLNIIDTNKNALPNPLCLNAENICLVLDAIGPKGVGYTFDTKDSKLSDLYQKLDEYRLTLSPTDHLVLFGKAMDSSGPFTLIRAQAPKLFTRANITLNHDQVHRLWDILPTEKRQNYFKNSHIGSDSVIEYQAGISSLDLYRLAIQEDLNHSLEFSPSQHRQLLSQLTLQQLQQHQALSYKHSAQTVESTFSTGSQYLASQYAFTSTYLSQIVTFITTYSVKMSMVLASAMAFAGSLALGLTVAWQQASENSRKEAQLRMQHMLNGINLNRLCDENKQLAIQLNALQNAHSQDSDQTRYPSHPLLPPSRSWWQRTKARISSWFRRSLHTLKPSESGLSPAMQGLITGLFITLALVSSVFIFATTLTNIIAGCAAVVALSLAVGVIRYQTVKHERMMENIVKQSDNELAEAQQVNRQLRLSVEALTAQPIASTTAKTNAEGAQIDTSLRSGTASVQAAALLAEHQRAYQQATKATHQLNGKASIAESELFSGDGVYDELAQALPLLQGQNQLDAHQGQLARFEF